MYKKNLKKILILFILSILPAKVYAESGKTILECNKTNVKPGDEITCVLTGNVSEYEVSAISSKITVSNGLTLGEIAVDPIWEGDGDGGNIQLYTDENKSSTFAIASFKVTVSKSIQDSLKETIKIESTKFYDEKYAGKTIEDTMVNLKILSSISTLSNITVSDGALTPNFSSDITNYSLTTTQEKLTINATATDANSKIIGDIGEVDIAYGENIFEINVTSESGLNTTKYVITVTRTDNRSADNRLDTLKINGNDISLTNDVYEYEYTFNNNIDEIKIDATLKDEKASFKDEYGPRTVKLEKNKTVIELIVEAENGDSRTYKITVINQNIQPDNSEDSSPNEKEEDKTETNPPTGTTAIYLVIGILIISIILSIYYFKFYSKKQGGE